MLNSSKLAIGDNSISPPSPPRYAENMSSDITDNNNIVSKENYEGGDGLDTEENITPQMIEDNEVKLKERIAQCKNVIESLKLQLTEEKEKMKTERKTQHLVKTSQYFPGYYHDATTTLSFGNTSMYSACIDSKLHCDEHLIEYEKQLQKYQDTLNMAQNEKKNAIRRQMLAKAFKLKLMEIENQCNIELLRVKQNLQCLEPLQMIANKWKTNAEENIFDVNNYELMPNFLELKAHSGSDVNSYKEEPRSLAQDNSALSD